KTPVERTRATTRRSLFGRPKTSGAATTACPMALLRRCEHFPRTTPMPETLSPFDIAKLQRQLDNCIPPDDWMTKMRWLFQQLTGCRWTPVKKRCKPCDGAGYDTDWD